MKNEPNTPPQPEPTSGGDRYERRDANVKWLFGIIGGLLLAVVCAEALMKWTVNWLEKIPPPADQLTGARRMPELSSAQPSFPRLQISPPQDLKEFRAREDAEMNTYGWIDANAGTVRIPIDRAMDLLLQRGLPVRAGINQSRLGPTPLELQQQRTNSIAPEPQISR